MFDIAIDGGRAALSGELTIYTAAAIKSRLGELLGEQASIEIDLAGVAEIDTAGLQLMLMLKRKPGAEVSFVHHSSAVLRLVDLANLAGTLGDPVLISAPARKEQDK